MKNILLFLTMITCSTVKPLTHTPNAGPISPESFGAKGDSTTDDTQALQNALNTNRDVVLDAGKTYSITHLTIRNDGQVLEGRGKIVSSATTGGVINMSQRSNVQIKGIEIIASGDKDAIGINIDTCTQVTISGVTVRKFGIAGIKISRSSACVISGNSFFDAAPNPLFSSPSSSDIFLSARDNNCSILNNICKSNGGYAIEIRTFKNGDHNDNHLVSGNIIDGYNSYGILIYRNAQVKIDVPNQSVSNINIMGNQVSNISGMRPSDPKKPETLIFGAGIYVQGAEGCNILYNRLSNTCLNNNSELLAPGAIGIANAGAVRVAGNTITDSKRFGIYVNDVLSYGDALGYVNIDSNSITGCGRSGIKISAKNNVTIMADTIDHCEFGIFVNSTDKKSNFNITNNIIRNMTSSGVALNSVSGAVITGNTIGKTNTHGLDLNNCNDFSVQNNNIADVASRGINVSATCSGNNSISKNTIQRAGVGVLLNAPVHMTRDNVLRSNSKDVQGTGAQQ